MRTVVSTTSGSVVRSAVTASTISLSVIIARTDDHVGRTWPPLQPVSRKAAKTTITLHGTPHPWGVSTQ